MNRENNTLIAELKALEIDAAIKKRDAEKLEYEAAIRHEGPMDMKKWVARAAASDARFEADVAQRLVSVQTELLRGHREQMQNGRSILATAKEELRTLGADPNV